MPNAAEIQHPDEPVNTPWEDEGQGVPNDEGNDDETPKGPPPPNPKVVKKVEGIINDMKTLEAQRKEINDKISALIEGAEAMGINRHALRAAKQYGEMSERKREAYDLSYTLARLAVGMPIQTDWVADNRDD